MWKKLIELVTPFKLYGNLINDPGTGRVLGLSPNIKFIGSVSNIFISQHLKKWLVRVDYTQKT